MNRSILEKQMLLFFCIYAIASTKFPIQKAAITLYLPQEPQKGRLTRRQPLLHTTYPNSFFTITKRRRLQKFCVIDPIIHSLLTVVSC